MEKSKGNKTEITASLGKEVKLENVKDNKKVANFSVVINEKDKEPKWVNCTAWDKTAEEISKIKPGTELHLIGSIKQNSYTKDEVTKTKESFTVYNFKETKQQLHGYLADDITLKKAGEHTVANFSLGIKDAKEEPHFIKCAAWNKAAEQMNTLKKGDEIIIEGKQLKDTMFVNKTEVISLKADRLKVQKEFNPDEVRGYLTSKPEMKEIGGKHVTNFSIGLKGTGGEPKFVNCNAWGITAEKLSKYNKGDELNFIGKMSTDKIDNQVFVVNNCDIKSTRQERLDEKLVKAVTNGDIEKTKELTVQGANVKAIKPDMLSKHEGELSEMLSSAMMEGVKEKSLAPDMQSNEVSKGIKV